MLPLYDALRGKLNFSSLLEFDVISSQGAGGVGGTAACVKGGC